MRVDTLFMLALVTRNPTWSSLLLGFTSIELRYCKHDVNDCLHVTVLPSSSWLMPEGPPDCRHDILNRSAGHMLRVLSDQAAALHVTEEASYYQYQLTGDVLGKEVSMAGALLAENWQLLFAKNAGQLLSLRSVLLLFLNQYCSSF
jgi:hypothetical protein